MFVKISLQLSVGTEELLSKVMPSPNIILVYFTKKAKVFVKISFKQKSGLVKLVITVIKMGAISTEY